MSDQRVKDRIDAAVLALPADQPSLIAASVGRTAQSQDSRRRTYELTENRKTGTSQLPVTLPPIHGPL